MRRLFLLMITCVVLISCSPVVVHAAANAPLAGRIVDKYGNPLLGVSVHATDAKTQAAVGTTTTDPFGRYLLTVPQGEYDLAFVPPAASGLQKFTQLHVATSDIPHTIILQSAPLSGLQTSMSGLGAVSSMVLFEIGIVLVGLLSYIGWRKKFFLAKTKK